MMISEKRKSQLRSHSKKALADVAVYSILICVCFLILYPLLSNIAAMFKSKDDLLDKSVVFIPKEFSVERIKQAVQGLDYWNVLLHTGLLCGLNALLQMMSCTIIGYGFARFKFPLKRVFFMLVIFTMMVPVQLLMPSYYVQFQKFDLFGLFQLFTGTPLRLLNSIWPFVLLSSLGLGFKNGLYIYFIRQYFINLPRELDESSRIDGAGFIRIFFRIMLPNAKPVLITVFMLAFSWQWTDQYLTGLFLPGKVFVPSALSSLTDYGGQFMDPIVVEAVVKSGVILVIIPLLLLYLFLQKYFVQGVERSGLVG